MSLKEWKNNEINTKLMKKWGFLKESRNEEYLDYGKDPSNLGFAGNHGGESCADVHPEDTAAAGGDPTKGHEDWQKRGGFEEWKAARDRIEEGGPGDEHDQFDKKERDAELEEGSAGDWSKMADEDDPTDLPPSNRRLDQQVMDDADEEEARYRAAEKVKAKGHVDTSGMGHRGWAGRSRRAAGSGNVFNMGETSGKISVREAKEITRRIIERIKLENK